MGNPETSLSTCLLWKPEHRPSDPCRQQQAAFAPKGLEEFDKRVGGWPPVRAEAKIVVGPVQPSAAEMAMRVGEAALKEVVVDVHTGRFRFRYLSSGIDRMISILRRVGKPNDGQLFIPLNIKAHAFGGSPESRFNAWIVVILGLI